MRFTTHSWPGKVLGPPRAFQELGKVISSLSLSQRFYFPCFDFPILKARSVLTHPHAYKIHPQRIQNPATASQPSWYTLFKYSSNTQFLSINSQLCNSFATQLTSYTLCQILNSSGFLLALDGWDRCSSILSLPHLSWNHEGSCYSPYWDNLRPWKHRKMVVFREKQYLPGHKTSSPCWLWPHTKPHSPEIDPIVVYHERFTWHRKDSNTQASDPQKSDFQANQRCQIPTVEDEMFRKAPLNRFRERNQ